MGVECFVLFGVYYWWLCICIRLLLYSNTILCTVYTATKLYSETPHTNIIVHIMHTTTPNTHTGAVAFVAGAAAAVGSSFVKVPLAVCIRSVQAGVYPNVFQAGKSITQAAGVRGLFTVCT